MGQGLAHTDQLVLDHLHLVNAVIKERFLRCIGPVGLDDLRGYGYIGLCQAAHRYDPARGVTFATFAWRRIAGSIGDGLRTWGYQTRRSKVAIVLYEDFYVAEAERSEDPGRGPLIREALAGLPTRQREIVLLVDVLELSQRELARYYDVSPSLICMELRAAHKMLRATLT